MCGEQLLVDSERLLLVVSTKSVGDRASPVPGEARQRMSRPYLGVNVPRRLAGVFPHIILGRALSRAFAFGLCGGRSGDGY